MAAIIKLRGIEPCVLALKTLVKNNIGDYLDGVELLYTGPDAIALPRPRDNSYYDAKIRSLDDAPALFFVGRTSRKDQQTGTHVSYLGPAGGHYIDMEAVLWNDNPELLAKMCYRYGLALEQLIASNYRLASPAIDFAYVTDVDFGNPVVLADHGNVCEQSVYMEIVVSTTEEY